MSSWPGHRGRHRRGESGGSLYYAADAPYWVLAESTVADDYARQAGAAYQDPTQPQWAFGSEAVSRTDLALIRIAHGGVEGAADALAPVFELPTEQRINGIIHSLNRVHHTLNNVSSSTPAGELQERIEDYARTPFACPRDRYHLCGERMDAHPPITPASALLGIPE